MVVPVRSLLLWLSWQALPPTTSLGLVGCYAPAGSAARFQMRSTPAQPVVGLGSHAAACHGEARNLDGTARGARAPSRNEDHTRRTLVPRSGGCQIGQVRGLALLGRWHEVPHPAVLPTHANEGHAGHLAVRLPRCVPARDGGCRGLVYRPARRRDGWCSRLGRLDQVGVACGWTIPAAGLA